MKKIILIITMVALLIGSFTFVTLAFGPRTGPGWGCRVSGFGFKKLNLSDDQQHKLLTIRQEFQKNTLSLRQDMQKKRQELRQLWTAETLNQSAIDAKTKEMNALGIQLVQKMREQFEKAKTVLTPEQLKQLEAMKQHRREGDRGCGMMFGKEGLEGNGI